MPLLLLQKMRREFEYWYPFDLRVSGKDLIQVGAMALIAQAAGRKDQAPASSRRALDSVLRDLAQRVVVTRARWLERFGVEHVWIDVPNPV